MRLAVILTFAALLAVSAAAQDHQPYAGFETRAIKALSEEEVADLRAGRGMGMALAAELNGYPGPRHVIDLAEALELSEDQLAEVEALFEAMQTETIAIGETLISQEEELDRGFAERTISPSEIDRLTQLIGETGGALRAAHLKYHLSTTELLTPEQAQRYAELRGYAGGGAHSGHGSHGERH
jgi:Spy/CpxP family protein refolding chaperone